MRNVRVKSALFACAVVGLWHLPVRGADSQVNRDESAVEGDLVDEEAPSAGPAAPIESEASLASDAAAPAQEGATPANAETAVPTPVSEGTSLALRATRWGNGERVETKDKGFSIVPPQGWEIYDNIPGSSLVFQVPAKPGMKYQATIQVSVFDGPMYIDKLTAMQFRDEIVKRYSNMRSVQQYEIRDEASLNFDDGAPGILYYSDFLLGETHMMQMHVLNSSKSQHFLMTYTDLADAFANRDDSSALNLAYASIVSAKTPDHPASRMDIASLVGVSVGLLVVMGFVYRIWSMRRLRRFADEENAAVAIETYPGDQATSAISAINAKLVFSKEPQSVQEKTLPEELSDKWELSHQSEALSTHGGDEGESRWSNLEDSSAPKPIDGEKERWKNLSRKEARLDIDDDQEVDEEPVSKIG